MSVGDRKGYLRRYNLLKKAGHAPKKSGGTVADSIARGKVARDRLASISHKK